MIVGRDTEKLTEAGVIKAAVEKYQPLAVELSDENLRQLYIPRHFAHGFLVLSDVAQFQYKVDNIYCPQSEVTLRFDDLAVGIDWPIAKEEMLLSAKDLVGMSLDDVKAHPEFSAD